jgi:hypothetical protein
MPQFKLGLRPPRPGAIKLRFADYINKPALPPLPAMFGSSIAPPQGWGMDGNDQAGDCVIAGFNHATMRWHSAVGSAVPAFNDSSALADYSRALVDAGENPFDPSDPSTDNGLDIQMAASWWRKTGITDAAGVKHQIKAYAAITDLNELLYGAYLFGVAGLGVDLPASAEEQFSRGQVWDDVTGPGIGGHFIPVIGRDIDGNLLIVTWGKTHRITQQFAVTRMIGAIAMFSLSYLSAAGLSPDMFDQAQLDDDLAGLPSVL